MQQCIIGSCVNVNQNKTCLKYCVWKCIKINPTITTAPLTMNVLIEARHITRIRNKAGGEQSIAAAPNVYIGNSARSAKIWLLQSISKL